VKKPNVDEHLDAAAWRILHDGNRHEPQAVLWAQERLEQQRYSALMRELYPPLRGPERRIGRRSEW
jgi:hypothetical protein